MKNHNPDSDILTFIGNELKTRYIPGKEWEIPDQIASQLAVLDKIAHHTNRVYSIFDFVKYDYLYCSNNVSLLAEEKHLDAIAGSPGRKYSSIVQDQKIISSFLNVRKELYPSLTINKRTSLGSSVCGGKILNLSNQLMRMHYRSVPLLLNRKKNVVLSFDYLEDISPLMSFSDGYWMRFTAGTRIFHWHSQTNKLVEKEIITPREKALISLWKDGHSVTEIAESLHISIQTVKNQMSNARKRLFARDNSSLIQLCYLTGILGPPF